MAAADLPWDPVAMAKLAQRAETEYVGVSCGLMDQYASAAARPGCALLLDCRSLEARPVPVPPAATIVIMDSGARRTLAGSAYNDRRSACAKAVEALQALRPEIRSLRDVDEPLVVEGRDRLDETVFLRALHVVHENRRPVLFSEALDRGDLAAAGKLMNESHESLRDLYEVSSPELDLLTDLARAHRACFGARLTGAGFGGCAVALVKSELAADFVSAVETGYRSRRPDLSGTFFAGRPSTGARLLGAP
jgi:galactokinase